MFCGGGSGQVIEIFHRREMVNSLGNTDNQGRGDDERYKGLTEVVGGFEEAAQKYHVKGGKNKQDIA